MVVEHTKQPLAVMIIPYFGKFGPWFPLFLRSLQQQSTLDLLLLTDATTPPLPDNVRRVESSLQRVQTLAEEKLKTTVSLFSTRKLCDLRPFYGIIFEDYIQDYPYWGFGDEDVLYGDLDRLLAPRLLEKPDILVPGNGMVIGHLTLLRNTPRINGLARSDPDHQRVLGDPAHWAYDETSWARRDECGSFTRTVKSAEAAGIIRVDWGLPKRGDLPWPGRFITYDGKSLHDRFGRDIAYYHWGRLRKRSWKFPSAEEAAAGFAFDSLGFHEIQLSRFRRRVRQALSYGLAAVDFPVSLMRRGMRRLRRWVRTRSNSSSRRPHG